MPVMELPEQNLELVKRLSAVQSATLPRGRIVLLPVYHDNGKILEIDVRVHPDGASGVLPLSEDLLEALGSRNPEDQFERLLDMKERFEDLWEPMLLEEESGVLAGIEIEE